MRVCVNTIKSIKNGTEIELTLTGEINKLSNSEIREIIEDRFENIDSEELNEIIENR